MNLDFVPVQDEAMLVDGCRQGNATAQKRLYERYAEPMMIVCLRYVSNPHDAKEVLMDGFFNFFKNIGNFNYRGEGSVRAWLKKIMVNQCLMFLRKKNVFHKDVDEVADEITSQDEASAVDQMSVRELMKLIHELPEGYRMVFNLYVFEEMTHREIAAMLNISENTSKSQLHKARQLLQKKFAQLQIAYA